MSADRAYGRTRELAVVPRAAHDGSAPVRRGAPHRDGNGVPVAWLWEVLGQPGDPQGVGGSLGQAQADAEEALQPGGTAVVESALISYNFRTRQQDYVRTGHRWAARRAGDHTCWWRLAARRS